MNHLRVVDGWFDARLDRYGRRGGVLAASLCALLALGGCTASAPRMESSHGVEIPETWSQPLLSAVAPATALALWWEGYDDPLLGVLVSQSQSRNSSINSARAALRHE